MARAGGDAKSAREHWNPSRLAIERPWSTAAVWACIVIAGAFAYAHLKYALLPDIALPVVTVTAQERTADVRKTERDLTVPLENSLQDTRPKSIASTTYPGRSVITLTYWFGESVDGAANAVRSRLRRTHLPSGSRYDVVPVNLNETAVNVYAVPLPTADRSQTVRNVQRILVPALSRVAGVRRVEFLGVPGQSSIARLNGRAVLEVRVIKAADANALDVARESDRVVTALGPRLRTKIFLATSQAPYIRSASHDTAETLGIAMLLAALVIYPFLRDLRATLISALAIPTSLAGAAIVMWLLHFNLDIITLLALALVTGVIIDDAIVDVENIARHIARGEPPREAAVAATNEIWLAASAATLTIVAVFLPIGLTGGNFGQFLRPFGLTASAAVLTSLAVARTLSPMLASRLLGPDDAKPPNPALVSRYARLVRGAIARPLRVIALAVATFLAGLALARVIPVGFMPHLDRGDFVVYMTAPDGAKLGTFSEKTSLIERAIRKDPDVQNVLTTIGAAQDQSQAEFDVTLRPSRHVTTLAVEDAVRALLPKVRHYTVSVQDTPFVQNGASKPFSLILSAPKLAEVDRAGARLKKALASTPGFVEVTRKASHQIRGVPSRIERYDDAYADEVDADLKGREIGDATTFAVHLAHRMAPPSVTVHLAGESNDVSDTLSGFAETLALSVLCVIGVLALLFRDWRSPLVILATLPLSIAGAMAGLLIWHAQFGIVSLLGFVFLFGLTEKNAILLVDLIRRLRSQSASLDEAVVEAGTTRLRPILMTTSATILGMLPISLGWGAGAELRAPMAAAIIGGLIASTLLTLVVVPAGYVFLSGERRKTTRAISVSARPRNIRRPAR